MAKMILLLALLALGGFAICYYGNGIFDCQYGSNTATLLDRIDSLPPTAAGGNR